MLVKADTSNSRNLGARESSSGSTYYDDLNAVPLERGRDDSFAIPGHLLTLAADVYFQYCHNQPYSLFHEASFRKRLTNGALPNYLCLAFVATARRFSTPGHFSKQDADTICVYSKEAWKQTMLRLADDVNPKEVIPILQTIILIAVSDYSGTLIMLSTSKLVLLSLT